MKEVWKKVDSLLWDEDDGQSVIAQLKQEGLIPVQPIDPEPVHNEQAYLILCEIQTETAS